MDAKKAFVGSGSRYTLAEVSSHSQSAVGRPVPSVTYHPESPLGDEQLLVEMSQKSLAPPAPHSISQGVKESGRVSPGWDR